MNNDKLREAAEKYIIDIRDKAALIANNAGEEKERFLGRQIILLCVGYLVLCSKVATAQAAPEPVDDKALAAALAWTDCELTTDEFSKKHVADLHACRKNESEYTGDAACRILAQALRAAQLEVAELKSIAPSLNDQEKAALEQLAEAKDMPAAAILKQSLRLYQLVHVRILEGHRFDFEIDCIDKARAAGEGKGAT